MGIETGKFNAEVENVSFKTTFHILTIIYNN